MSEMPRAQVSKLDDLTGELLKAAPSLLTYEVEVLNAAGRSAGASNAAYAASGAAPAAATELRAEVTEAGVVLRWKPAAEPGAEVMLRRERVNAPAAKAGRNPLGAPSEPDVQMLRARKDEGGTLDASAVFGEQYAYTAQRVKLLTLGGQSVELRSEQSAAVNVDVKDVFPPKVPTGLVASVPMRAADGSYAVDLSWDANTEADLAGYVVYRTDISLYVESDLTGNYANREEINDPIDDTKQSGWGLQPLKRQVQTPAYHDTEADAGRVYMYRVSAVDKSGNESGRSAAVQVVIPQETK
jgi:hypothetical protein